MRASNCTQPAGLTMLELMVAVLILAIALAAVAAGTQNGHLADAASFDRTKSTKIAEQLMEEVLALADTDEALLVDEDALISEGFAVKINVTQRSVGLVEVEVLCLRPTTEITPTDLVNMSVEEFWNQPSAGSSRVRLISLKADGI